MLPTPAVAYLTRKHKVDAGVVISASHNPMEFNGIKFFNGEGYKPVSYTHLAVFLGIYLVLTYSIYSARYEKGRKASREYYHTLKRVNEMYRQEDTAKTPEEWL